MLIYPILTITLTLYAILFYIYIKLSKNLDTILLHKDVILCYYPFFFALFLITVILLLILLLLQRFKIDFTNRQKVTKSNIFYQIYGMIFKYLDPNYTQYLVTLARLFLAWSPKTKIYLIILFVAMPTFVIALTLLWEFYFGELHYYFYALLLCLIPLLFNCLLFMLYDLAAKLIPEFRKLIDTDTNVSDIEIDLPEGKKTFGRIGFRFKPEYADGDLDHFMENFYYPVLFIQGDLDVYFLPKYYIITKITVFFYLIIHLFVWCYILFSVL